MEYTQIDPVEFFASTKNKNEYVTFYATMMHLEAPSPNKKFVSFLVSCGIRKQVICLHVYEDYQRDCLDVASKKITAGDQVLIWGKAKGVSEFAGHKVHGDVALVVCHKIKLVKKSSSAQLGVFDQLIKQSKKHEDKPDSYELAEWCFQRWLKVPENCTLVREYEVLGYRVDFVLVHRRTGKPYHAFEIDGAQHDRSKEEDIKRMKEIRNELKIEFTRYKNDEVFALCRKDGIEF